MKRWQYLFSVQLNFNKLSSTEKPDKSNYDRLVYKPTVTTHELCMDGVYAIYLSLFWEYRLFKGQIIVQFIFGCCYIYFIFLVFIYFIIAQNKHIYLWTKVKLQKRKKKEEREKEIRIPCATSLPEQMGATLHSVCWKAASTWRLPLP